MNTERPDTTKVLAQLKDFQRDTVDYIFQRMYVDANCTRRFLVADEVGIGKTLVARGLIAKVIDHLWDRGGRIDIVYICSNADIARQNINRLNVTDKQDFALASRITLLPLTLGDAQRGRLNFISFTPGTSFDMKSKLGKSGERELLYWLLVQAWQTDSTAAKNVLQGQAGTDRFRSALKAFPHKELDQPLADMFAAELQRQNVLRERFVDLCQRFPRANSQVPAELVGERRQVVGRLRELLAQTCLKALEPDLIILDEFQRFKHLLDEGSDESQLARDLFNYQQEAADPATAARVLLLSATPYKMYTLAHEATTDHHYDDFRRTLDFLLAEKAPQARYTEILSRYRQELFRLAEAGPGALTLVQRELEAALRHVMVRTERLANSTDRNGMLVEVSPTGLRLEAADLGQYLTLQKVAETLEHHDTLEYWKSAPYLLNFMDEYKLKHDFNEAIQDRRSENSKRLAKSLAAADGALLNAKQIERYRRIDAGNVRLRSLLDDTVGRGAWRCLWMPPAFPYYKSGGAYADQQLVGFTKRLVFSCWRVVPRVIASLLSYEAERLMTLSFSKKAHNTHEAREKRRALLKFSSSKGRLTGMPVLGLVYPCETLARRFDPYQRTAAEQGTGQLPSVGQLVQRIEPEIQTLLEPLIRDKQANGPEDESWYWAAPILLDLQHHPETTRAWFDQPSLAARWMGEDAQDTGDSGWAQHVAEAQELLVNGTAALGPCPADLSGVLARMALAAPGVAAWRSLHRVVPATADSFDARLPAAQVAYGFLSLFNQPDVMSLIRDKTRDKARAAPYWHKVLEHCLEGGLQAVLDEYAHVLVESLGLIEKPPATVAEKLGEEIRGVLTLRTATAKADIFRAHRGRVNRRDDIRFRNRFAMRFGDQEHDDAAAGASTRADQVRKAFNSPFWPFVLATTSVGQEGLDFHPYCHAVVHWNLPSNPVDLEQREGRVHRYKGHAVRKNVARAFGTAMTVADQVDPWIAMFAAAREARRDCENDLVPFWLMPDGIAKIERHVPALPLSRDRRQRDELLRSLVFYRMVFGQSRQEDLVEYLREHLPAMDVERLSRELQIDLRPPRRGKT